jgi:hypothetical protein
MAGRVSVSVCVGDIQGILTGYAYETIRKTRSSQARPKGRMCWNPAASVGSPKDRVSA